MAIEAISASRKTIMLTITETCNLDCVYCYEHNKKSREMSRELILNIVENALKESSTAMEISFHGGEPFLKFDLMRETAEYFWKKYNPENKYVFFVTTNGTLLTDEIKKWLSEHKEHFWCGLSFDGTEDMQNKNRSNSAKDVDLEFFAKTWPEQGVKMTVSDLTLSDLAAGTIFLHNKGFDVNNNLAYGIDWNNNAIITVFSEQLEILMEFYLDNPDIKPSSILSMNIEWFIKDSSIKQERFCGAGKQMKCFDTNGKEYPCHFFMDMNFNKNIPKISNMEMLHSDDCLQDPFCKDCEIRLVCPTCYGYNYVTTGNPIKRDRNHCILAKIQAVACAIFALRRIKRYGKLTIKGEEIPIGNALHGIDSVLNNEFFLNDERLRDFKLI
ncbi:MAG: radical SAM protein [Treponema sp.]|jgi:radical SAM protein with 4Fe4S-binding SPASM domain|nr:radical SAM protein [Treponema sp.]